MNTFAFRPLLWATTALLAGLATNAVAGEPGSPAAIKRSYGDIALSFEANRGQADGKVKYLARAADYSVLLTNTETIVKSRRGLIRMTLVGANPAPMVKAVDLQAGKSNYFLGNDPAKWLRDVPQYGRVEYSGVYAGVDLAYYGNGRQLEYDWIVNPGANPRGIRMRYDGVQRLRIDKNGDLILETADGSLRHQKPLVYQDRDGRRETLNGRFVLRGKHEVSFEVASYDRTRPLTIDPVLAYSSYLGGSGIDIAFDVTVDGNGYAYITGSTNSVNFPTQQPIETYHPSEQTCAYSYYDPVRGGQTAQEPCFDAFVTKMNTAGNALVYSTYIGGSSQDGGIRIRVDSSGDAFVAAASSSADFPIVNAYKSQIGVGGSSVLFELNPSGNGLIFSTFFASPSDDYNLIKGLAIDGTGIYIAGTTENPDFPVVNSLYPFMGNSNASECWASKFNLSASALIYSTFLASPCNVQDMAIDGSGNSYVVGSALTGLPVVNAFQPEWTPSPDGGSDAFILVLNASASGLIYSTYLGGNDIDEGLAVAVNPLDGTAYVAGRTLSPTAWGAKAFPTTPGAFQTYRRNCTPTACIPDSSADAWVAKFAPDGTLLASTLIGGTQQNNADISVLLESKAYGVAFDQAGSVFLGGYTVCTDFPSVSAVQPVNAGGEDVFMVKFDSTLSTLLFSTYFGGSGDDWGYSMALDSNDSIYMVGKTTLPATGLAPFPTSALLNPFQSTYQSLLTSAGSNGFIVKIANADLSLAISPAQPSAGITGTRVNSPKTKNPHPLGSQPNPIPTSPTGPFNTTVGITNQTGSNSSYGADNVNLTLVGGLPGHSSVATCYYGSSQLCENPTSNENLLLPTQGVSLGTGETLNVNLSFNLDGTLPPGTVVTWNFYTHSDTNDPDPSNNYASVSAVVALPVTLQTMPEGLPITVDGIPQGTTPTIFYLLSASETHTYCAAPSGTVNGVMYTFSTWNQGGLPTQNCQTFTLSAATTLTASYVVSPYTISGTVTPPVSGATMMLSGSQTGSTPITNSGSYSITVAAGGNYTLTPLLTGYNFSPTSASFNNLSGSQTANFTDAVIPAGAPFGSFDTPATSPSNGSGGVGFTGWALSPAGISMVDVWREANPGEAPPGYLVYIGTAETITGSRTDVQSLYPNYPGSASAGWGFQILTNELPSNSGNTGVGNGTYNIHAIAHDLAGNKTDLGVKTLVVDNKDAIYPFGSIDTPAQGGTASGSAYVNFGWALTPQPKSIPIDGSTIRVYIDNQPVGHPVYNQPRSDIETLFPGYANTNGAVGYYYIDTTTLTNGIHNIAWSVTDSAGITGGIGSRFFIVQN